MNDNFVTPIIKITDCCNYNCQFCYYAQKKRSLANSIMPIELLKEIICSVVEVNRLQKRNKTHLIFHGGEPLLAGLSYFQEIMAFESEIIVKYPDISFENSIETNGYLLNDTWIEFFRDNNYGVGISIDGPAEMNYHKRFLHDVESEQIVLKNINRMNELKAPFGVMSVITDDHLDNADELYSFYVTNEIHNVGFCYCFNHDTNDSVNPEKLVSFLKRFFDLYYNGKYKLRVREYEEMIKRLLGKENNLCLFCDRKRCGNYPTIDYDGNVFFCDFGTEKDRSVGNLQHSSLFSIMHSNEWEIESKKARAILLQSCKSCEANKICGKICYRSDICVNGSDLKNYFCSVYPAIMRYVQSKII